MFKPTVTGPSSAQFRELERQIRERAEGALLRASHTGGRIAVGRVKRAMSSAGLGRLGSGKSDLGASDLRSAPRRRGAVHPAADSTA